VQQVIEPERALCPCGCGEMARIGQDVSDGWRAWNDRKDRGSSSNAGSIYAEGS
jgi:hypothetical protein